MKIKKSNNKKNEIIENGDIADKSNSCVCAFLFWVFIFNNFKHLTYNSLETISDLSFVYRTITNNITHCDGLIMTQIIFFFLGKKKTNEYVFLIDIYSIHKHFLKLR